MNTRIVCISLLTAGVLFNSESAFASNYTLGTEFQINTYTNNAQHNSSVASNGTDYLVTWTSYGQDGSDNGVYGQMIGASGNYIGTESQINTYTDDRQESPSVASNGTDYLVTWQGIENTAIGHVQDGSGYGVYGQMIDRAGGPVGSEFLINTFTEYSQAIPAVASNGTDYLVTWQSNNQDGSTDSIYGQMINKEGESVGSEFKINTYTNSYQLSPFVASNGTDYLVTWTSHDQDGDNGGIYGQMISATGTFVNGEFRINTFTEDNQAECSVASNGTNYLVTWQSNNQDGSDLGVYGQLIDDSGVFIGSEFQINTFSYSLQGYPSVTSNGTDYLVTWQSNNQDGSVASIYGQLIDALGHFVGSEFLVNTYTADWQSYPSVTSNGTDYLITWTSYGQDGNMDGIYGKLLTQGTAVPEPTTLIMLGLGIVGIIRRKYTK